MKKSKAISVTVRFGHASIYRLHLSYTPFSYASSRLLYIFLQVTFIPNYPKIAGT